MRLPARQSILLNRIQRRSNDRHYTCPPRFAAKKAGLKFPKVLVSSAPLGIGLFTEYFARPDVHQVPRNLTYHRFTKYFAQPERIMGSRIQDRRTTSRTAISSGEVKNRYTFGRSQEPLYLRSRESTRNPPIRDHANAHYMTSLFKNTRKQTTVEFGDGVDHDDGGLDLRVLGLMIELMG